MDDSKRLELITEAVRYCQRVRSLGMPPSCFSKALREPIYFLWEKRGGTKEQAPTFRSRATTGLRFGKRELVYDHAVPFRYLQNELLSLESVTVDSVAEVLNRFGTAVLITAAENALLNAAGFGSKMPDDWNGIDPMARYTAARIELIENR